ncbi:UNVERIFIED_CONTAM: hypothetical protein GTU68_007352 [Idotea baltica]|nr:hypothetical protein [Idotea baltica]
MPIYSPMFPILHRRRHRKWTAEGILAGLLPNPALQPMGRTRT